MPNQMASLLTTLDPDFTYAFDEDSGTSYANGGSGGVYALPTVRGTTFERLNFRMPGVIRGAPAEYGYWVFPPGNDSIPGLGAGGLAALNSTGWNTGCFMVVGAVSGKPEQMTLLELRYGNDFVRLTLETNGRIRFAIFQSSPANQWQVETPDNTIVNGEPFLILVYQRGDGTGIHVKFNDVDQTLTETRGGAGAGNDDAWIADILDSSTTHTDTTINNQNRVTNWGTGTNMIVQRPTWWINDVPSDSQMTSLFTQGCNFDGIPQELFHTVLSLSTDEKPRYYIPMAISTENSVDNVSMPQFAPLINDVNYNANSWMRVPGFAADPPDFVEDTEVIPSVADTFKYHKFNADGTEISPKTSTNTPTNLQATETTGTVAIVFKFDDGISVGNSEPIWKLQLNNAGTAYIELRVGAATGPIYTLTGEISDATNVYTITAVGDISINDHVLLTMVQDGISGLKIYLDDNELSVSPSGLLDEDSWINALPKDAADGLPQELSIGGGVFGEDLDGNGMGTFMWFPNALTGAEVLQLYQATIGIFPEDDDAQWPDGGFADTLDETGNEGDPNGPGPDHWWRLNETPGNLPVDRGISVIDGTAIATGGDPAEQQQGPLILDATNAAIYFDGVGDYYEVGVDGIAGELVTDAIGTVGFFISANDLTADNVVYSQSNDAATAYINFGVNNGFLELYVQTSAGNSVTYTSSIQITDFNFIFGVITNDGSDYIWYVQGVADDDATLTTDGTGAEGDWFDSATWTRSAIAARADSIFTTETQARLSEIFIYDEVLTAAQIGALFDAAGRDGIAGFANAATRLVFEDCIFRNGGLADVRAENARSTINMALLVDNCSFIGGAQSADAAGVLVKGAVNAQVNGNSFDLGETPSTGRVAIKATTLDPTAAPTVYYSMLAAHNVLEQMGRADAPAIFVESGFGATISANQIFRSIGAGIGWRADAQNINALRNMIDGVSSAVAGIWVQNSLNTAAGRAWQLIGNSVLDSLGRGISIEGYNSSLAERARHILLQHNLIVNPATQGMYLAQVRDVKAGGNVINGGTNGIELSTLLGIIAINKNKVEGHSGTAIILQEAGNVATLIVNGNTLTGVLTNDGILIDGVSTAHVFDNELINIQNGLQIGDITTFMRVFDNKMINVTTPLDLLTGKTQVALDIGRNTWSSLGNALELTVTANEVDVINGYHEITAASAVDLNSINGEARTGRKVILRVATGSSIITAKDGVGDMNLSADFAMDPGDMLTLIKNDAGTWDERSRSNNG